MRQYDSTLNTLPILSIMASITGKINQLIISQMNPSLYPDNHIITTNPPNQGNNMCAYVNSDWASNLKHKNSVIGIVIMYAGGAIGYKIKYQ